MEDIKKCQYCAEEVNIAAIKCKHCGSKLKRGKESGNSRILKWSIFLLVVVFLGLVVESIVFYLSIQKYNAYISSLNDQYSINVAAAQAVVNEKVDALETALDDIGSLKLILEGSTETNTSLQQEVAELTERYETLNGQIYDLRSKNRALERKANTAENALMCTGARPNINYSSNSTVSSSIKTWLENNEGSMTDTEWEVVWNNSKTTIHRLTGEYLWVYIAYFPEDGLDFTTAVFDINRQCWLSLASK